jgi:hypothetical protein
MGGGGLVNSDHGKKDKKRLSKMLSSSCPYFMSKNKAKNSKVKNSCVPLRLTNNPAHGASHVYVEICEVGLLYKWVFFMSVSSS